MIGWVDTKAAGALRRLRRSQTCRRQGDDAAWEAVVNSFGKRIYNLSYRYTNHREEAEA
jgi:hypothetical protein